MENKAIGLLTGAIKSEGEFLALVTKIRLQNGNDELLYFPFTQLKGLLFTLQTKLALMHENGTFSAEQSSQETLQEEALYRQQTIQFTDAEMNVPDAQKAVKTLATLPGEGYITLDIECINGRRLSVVITDPAIEIFSGYTLHALKAVGGDTLLTQALSNLDFMSLYSVEYSPHGELDYDYYKQDPWQMSALKNHLAILYTVKNGNKKEVKCAAIVKTSIKSGTPESLDMARRIADILPRLATYKNRIYSIYTQTLVTQSDHPIELDAALDVLSRLYLTHSAAGNA